MKCCARQFNLYLPLLVILGLLCGCRTGDQNQQTAALRIHIESKGNLETTGQTVSVLRIDPVLVTIASDPILTEANIIKAAIIQTPGGFAVEVKFDETGTWTLEQFTAANPGRHLAIFGQWGKQVTQGRWLAAPLITHRISDGVLAFTPDASRAEADQLVHGLNTAAQKNLKALMK